MVGCIPSIWERAQVQGLKDSQITIKEDKDQDLVHMVYL